jgi:hypothetical protein
VNYGERESAALSVRFVRDASFADLSNDVACYVATLKPPFRCLFFDFIFSRRTGEITGPMILVFRLRDCLRNHWRCALAVNDLTFSRSNTLRRSHLFPHTKPNYTSSVRFDFGTLLPQPLQLSMSGIPYSGTWLLLCTVKEVTGRQSTDIMRLALCGWIF